MQAKNGGQCAEIEQYSRRIDLRAALMARSYLRRFASRRDEVLAPGETLKLIETGNHAQGCIFRDGMHRIYDARNSVFSAYRTLFRQWRLIFAVDAANRANGHAPSSLAALWRNWRQYSAAALSYPVAD
jgi:hypothetical protein